MAHSYEGMVGPNGEALDYTRLSTFGTPFIGVPEFVPDKELLDKTVKFQRFGFGLFSTKEPSRQACNRTYGEVMEGASNNGWQIVYRSTPDIRSEDEVWIYLEWYETYAINKSSPIPARIEDDKRNKSQSKIDANQHKRPRRVVRRRKPT